MPFGTIRLQLAAQIAIRHDAAGSGEARHAVLCRPIEELGEAAPNRRQCPLAEPGRVLFAGSDPALSLGFDAGEADFPVLYLDGRPFHGLRTGPGQTVDGNASRKWQIQGHTDAVDELTGRRRADDFPDD